MNGSNCNTKITEIPNKAACAAWCPVQSAAEEHPGLIALGSKDSGGVGDSAANFSAKGGELELYSISTLAEEPPVLCGNVVSTQDRFASIAWSKRQEETSQQEYGVLAGGMADGAILLFDPAAILANSEDSCGLGNVSTPEACGPVTALQFSPLNKLHLCAGTYAGHVLIVDVGDNNKVLLETETGHEVTAVAWNTAVAHICATASTDGSVTVWDIQAQTPWAQVRAEHSAISDICWNPSQGLHLLTASADDRNPVLRVWDLGASTSVPLATLAGHSAGLMHVAWCPHDDSFLFTVSKDNRTLLWDLHTLTAVAELPIESSSTAAVEQQQQQSTAGALFASGRPGLQEQKQLRYDISWSPFQRGVVLTCSLDRKVQVHSMLSLHTGRPPAWMQRKSCVSTGFGGLLLSCGTHSRSVTVRNVPESPDICETAIRHETDVLSTEIVEFAKSQQEKAATADDKAMWGFMQVIFQANARQELLLHLGFDAEEIAAAASDGNVVNGMSNLSVSNHGDDTAAKAPSTSSQHMVKKALLVGNFEAAVECCFQSGNLGDALLLASCGGGDLWTQTQERYFSSEKSKRPYLAVLSGIVHNQLEDVVAKSNPSAWEETLAVLSTYAQAEEFPILCIALGDLLQGAGDAASACLCYMSALNLERAVEYWKAQLEKALSGKDFHSLSDVKALHEFVVKVSVFGQVAGGSLTAEVEELHTKYAQILADQGLLVTATKYCSGVSEQANVLRDRLYRSRASQRCFAVLGGTAPEFPYAMVTVEQSRGQVMVQPKVQETPEDAAKAFSQQPVQVEPATQQDQTQSVTENATDHLPEGWVALQDPSSGSTYYANEASGQTTWERPLAAPAPAASSPPAASYSQAATTPTAAAYDQQGTARNTSHDATALDTSQSSQAASAQSSAKPSLASKYGDGFVSSASNPELAFQYGNVGTSNPYGEANRPGTAAAVVQTPTKDAPVSGSLNFDSVQLDSNQVSIKDTLLGLADALKQTNLNPVEKRQLAEAERGVAILVKKLALVSLSDTIVQQVFALVGAVSSHDFAQAVAIQTALANAEWREQKDWLKGIKILMQLAAKKYA